LCGFLESFVVLIDAIVGKAKIQSHFGVVFGLFLNFRKVFPQIWEKLLQFPIQIASNDNFDVIFGDDVNNVFLLVNLGEVLHFLPGQSHQKLDLFLCSIEILDGKGIERSVFDSQFEAVE
jgi:hypothetical protein